MKASQLAKIEALKLRALADATYYQVLGGLRGEFAMDAASCINNRAEDMAVLALEFEQEERRQTTTADGGGR